MERQDLEKSVMEKILLAGIKEQRSARRWKVFFRLVWLVIIAGLFYHAFAKNDKLSSSKPSVGLSG
jgi:protease IV